MVLASPTFVRAQRLVKLLVYISEKHFEGLDKDVCEYTIATEVLGRPAEFDPAQDAIARVEIHRLRKKLREYYSAEGAQRTIKIIIPPGMYTPVFQRDGNSASPPPVTATALAEPAVGPSPSPLLKEPPEETRPAMPRMALPPANPGNRIWLLAGLGVILIAGAGAVATLRTSVRPPSEPVPSAPSPGVAPATPSLVALPPVTSASGHNAMRIIAGGDRQYIDHDGHAWLPDRYFVGGGQPGAPLRQFIARTSDPFLYRNGRVGLTSYEIPLKPGNYELKLHFVEPIYGPGLETAGGENSRVFDIAVNGVVLINAFDIVSDAGGPLVADVRVFKDVQPSADGILRIGFHALREQALVSAIEVEPAPLHRINPIRIVTQSTSVTDSKGQLWEADNYYSGGQTSNHSRTVSGTADGDLFNNERYGHFSYAIPVAPGSYTVTLYFAETFWGKGNEGGDGHGQRVFDVYCNGLALLRNLEVLKEAGPDHALIKRFRGLRANAQGKLNLEFVPVVNYASVYAIEVLDEGR